MISAMSSALSGINRSHLMMYAASANISRSNIENAQTIEISGDNLVKRSDSIDISEQAIQMMQAQMVQAAQIPVIRTADEMNKTLLDIIA